MIKEALAKVAQQMENGSAKHPVHKVLEFISMTPLDMVPYKHQQNGDGSMSVTIEIPSLADQAKQKAMQEALKQQGQGQASQPEAKGPKTVEQLTETPAAPTQPAVAGTQVKVKVANVKDVTKMLKGKYPDGFLKGMGLE